MKSLKILSSENLKRDKQANITDSTESLCKQRKTLKLKWAC